MADTQPRRFVIQHHRGHGPDHWDLMLEDGDVLVTWRLNHPPRSDDDTPIDAIRLADHRKAYLTYEGPVSGGRGRVAIYDSGTYVAIERTPRSWVFQMKGGRVAGDFTLRVAGEGRDERGTWKLGRSFDREDRGGAVVESDPPGP